MTRRLMFLFAVAMTCTTAALAQLHHFGPSHLIPGDTLTAPKLGRHVEHYQWLRCKRHRCTEIRGATHRRYMLVLADVGYYLEVRETLQGGATVTSPPTVAVSAPTSVVSPPLPVDISPPVLTDLGPGSLTDTVVGDKLTTTQGVWNFAVCVTYQWVDVNPTTLAVTPIAGATTAVYTVQTSDIGFEIASQVTAYNYSPAGCTPYVEGS